jgi:hypothetical protein
MTEQATQHQRDETVQYRQATRDKPTAMEATLGEKPGIPESKPAVPRRPDVLASAKWHDGAIEEFKDSPFFQNASKRHRDVVEMINGLDALKQARDPRVTLARHNEDLATKAEAAAKRIDARFLETMKASLDHESALRNTLNEQLGVAHDSEYGAEIRAKLSSMSPSERLQAIYAAAADGDTDVVAAALHGPTFLTGLDAAEREKVRSRLAKIKAPKLVAELEAVRRSAGKLEEAHLEASAFIQQHYIDRSHEPDVLKAERQRSAFDDALNKL